MLFYSINQDTASLLPIFSYGLLCWTVPPVSPIFPFLPSSYYNHISIFPALSTISSYPIFFTIPLLFFWPFIFSSKFLNESLYLL